MARISSATGSSSDVYFDTRTKAVMTHVDKYSREQLKEKIATIREIVPNKSNDEIVLVLQHFDGDLEKAIQSFTDDGAAEVLNEWSYQGKKGKTSSKKNKKKKSKQLQESDSKHGDTANAVQQPVSTKNQTVSTKQPISENSVKNVENTTCVATHDSATTSQERMPPLVTPEESKVSSLEASDKPHRPETSHKDEHSKAVPSKDHKSGRHSKRERTISEKSTSSQKGNEKSEKKTGGALDKSVKDLQRTTVSLGHHHNKHTEEMENAFKKIKSAFADVHTILQNREVELLRELNSIKEQAATMFGKRQHEAVELKRRAEQVKFLSEVQLLELRADIKHFVSDRKIDEALGRTSRFQADASAFEEHVNSFGEVTPITSQYSTRRHSLTSLSSDLSRSTSVNEDLTPHGRNPSDALMDVEPTDDGISIPTAVPGIQMTAAEIRELQNKLLKSLKAQGLPVPKSPPHRNKGHNTKDSNQNQFNKPASQKKEIFRKPHRDHDRPQNRQQDRLDKQKDSQQNKLQERQNDKQHDKYQDTQSEKQDQRHSDSQTTKIVRRREQYRRRKRERQSHSESNDTVVNEGKPNSLENGSAEKGSTQTKSYENKMKPKQNRNTWTRNHSAKKQQGRPNKVDDTAQKEENIEYNKIEENKKQEKSGVKSTAQENDRQPNEDTQVNVEIKPPNTEVGYKPLTNGAIPQSPKGKRPPRKPRPASVPNGVIHNGHTKKETEGKKHEGEDLANNNKDNIDNALVNGVVSSTTDLKVKTSNQEKPVQSGHVNVSVTVDE
ncbi:SPATS2-like protein isoform X2 [Anneissia japonica]|uniref:SPATS2-like protein isoform X2 n=1 Tax=Anneissia japonica TaxID=1529436 RepID=UPI0014257337|nr:SPATS2-like protein isoform X2 [Anneissia japonica]